MANRYGFDSYTAVGKETVTTYPPTAVARTKFQEIYGESGGFDPGRKELQSWRGRVAQGFVDVGAKVMKSLTFPMTYENLLFFIRNALWATYAFDATATPANLHTFKLGTTQPNPLSIEVANSESGSTAELTKGCYVKKMVLDFKADDASSVQIDYLGIRSAPVAKTGSPSIASQALYVKPGTFTIVLDSDSGESLELDSATVTVEAGLDDGRVKLKGDANIVKPQPTGKAVVTASFARDYLSASMQDKLVSGAPVNFRVKSTGGIIAGSDRYYFEVWIPQLVVKGDAIAHTGPGIVPENINGQAQEDAANSACQVIIMNTEATL